MPNTRTEVFSRVSIDYSVRGTTTVSWKLRPFRDPEPHSFQLQVSDNGGDVWTNVGISADNIVQAMDGTQRLYGKTRRLTYRVVLTTPIATYASPPAAPLGNMPKRMWLIAREIIRRNKIEVKQQGLRSLDGWLIKRKVKGTVCTACVDPHTGGITNSDCSACQGTGFIDGYWNAIAHNMIDLSPETKKTHRGNRLQRGTVADIVLPGRFIGLPVINSRDVWVDATNDRRFIIHRVMHKAELNQVPLVIDAELRLVEMSDIVYDVSVPVLV